MKKGRGGKEREVPTQLIEISELIPMLHALLKIGITARYICGQEKKVANPHGEACRDA